MLGSRIEGSEWIMAATIVIVIAIIIKSIVKFDSRVRPPLTAGCVTLDKFLDFSGLSCLVCTCR